MCQIFDMTENLKNFVKFLELSGAEEGAIYENAKTAVRMGAKLPKP
jgi:hypothetical protein